MDYTKEDKNWVQIEKVVLLPKERKAKLPLETKKLPYVMRANGFLLDKFAKLNTTVRIRTLAGRIIKGKLVQINPGYKHSFGKSIVELINLKSG